MVQTYSIGLFERTVRQSFLRAPKKQRESAAAYGQRFSKYKARLSAVPAERLFDIIFERRAKGGIEHNPVINAVLDALHQAGMEDPFEEVPKIITYVNKLFATYKPQTELDKALLICRAVIPQGQLFFFQETWCFGLPTGGRTMGLNVEPNVDDSHPSRIGIGALLPKHYFSFKSNNNVARCLEYGFLITVLLRAAGIPARIKMEKSHAYVIAETAQGKYHLDMAGLEFKRVKLSVHSDREAIAMHYSNKGVALRIQGKPEKAITAFNMALEFNPRCDKAWDNKGVALKYQGKLKEAIAAYSKALEINPRNDVARENKGEALAELRNSAPKGAATR